jgi:hypothetical protein
MIFLSFDTQFECGLSTSVSSQMIFPHSVHNLNTVSQTILIFGNSQQNIIA